MLWKDNWVSGVFFSSLFLSLFLIIFVKLNHHIGFHTPFIIEKNEEAEEQTDEDYFLGYGSFVLRVFMGQFVDGSKFTGGSESLMPKSFIKEETKLAHKNDIYGSTSTGD